MSESVDARVAMSMMRNGRTSSSTGTSATLAPPSAKWLGASKCVPLCSFNSHAFAQATVLRI